MQMMLALKCASHQTLAPTNILSSDNLQAFWYNLIIIITIIIISTITIIIIIIIVSNLYSAYYRKNEHRCYSTKLRIKITIKSNNWAKIDILA